ncbi:MAG: hypothetical protein JWP63_3706 [Candidatus Solibacter sp.]|nr:hypothetical protein [Candidatus Solibacter sp.]
MSNGRYRHKYQVLLALVLLELPATAAGRIDPGTGTMLWQLAAGAVIGGLFFVNEILASVRNRFGSSSPVAAGFLFATAYAMVAIPVVLIIFAGHALPRFNDVFLIGIVLTAYLFRWEPSAYLLGIALLVSAWILPPYGTFRVVGFAEWYRMFSFTVVAIFLMHLVTRSKNRKMGGESAQPAYAIRRAAAGAD